MFMLKVSAAMIIGAGVMLTGAAQGSALIMAAPFIILMTIICVKG
jgi:hypothetical protein